MTDRERCHVEYEQAQSSARRAVLLVIVVLFGALLGYHPTPAANSPATIGTALMAP